MQISILGCGWLGFPLAKSLLKKGFEVKGSTTTLEKISKLEANGIQPSIVTLSAVEGQKNENEINTFLQNAEVLIINIPPKLRGNSNENFVQKIKNLIPFIEKSSVEKVIFVSSTSVYSDDTAINLITEETIPKPDTESGKQLLETEILLQNNPNFKTTIIRFGGLISKDRHPIVFLAGRKNIENPEAAINLIHLDDCIGIIEKIIEKNFFDQTINAVAPFHPTRKDYYQQKAKELQLPLPEFEEGKKSIGKIISSEKVETVLEYTFKKPQL
ncbi:NAD(P)H-binding protein [Flavobacterium sp.]|uniref:NAD(P)H-binding protein n=1 Tax=Flavobacterium sp. TaxID=239 RepID=UPI0035B3B183